MLAQGTQLLMACHPQCVMLQVCFMNVAGVATLREWDSDVTVEVSTTLNKNMWDP
jgi:hypothetical protein